MSELYNMDSTIKAVQNALAEGIDEVINWDTLHKQAGIFINEYARLNEIEQNDSVIQDMIKTLGNVNHSHNIVYKVAKENKSKVFILRAQYLLAFKFDEYLTKFRNELPKKALFVHYDRKKQQISSYEASMQDLALRIGAGSKIGIPQKSALADELKFQEKETELNQDHVKKAQYAYLGTSNRMDRYYEKTKIDKKQIALLMWEENASGWRVARVSGYGDIKEAYIAALFTKHGENMDKLCGINEGENPFYSHELIETFFKEYIQNVTNLAAIKQEDVRTDSAQYAVKGAGATAPNLSQYLSTAQYIYENKEALSVSQINSWLNETFPWDAPRNEILNTTQLLADNEKDDLIQDLFNEWPRISALKEKDKNGKLIKGQKAREINLVIKKHL